MAEMPILKAQMVPPLALDITGLCPPLAQRPTGRIPMETNQDTLLGISLKTPCRMD